jgi:hypothetical protein
MEHLRALDPELPIPSDYLQLLPLDGHVIEVDTTDFAAIDYPCLLTRIQLVLGE